MQSSRLRRLSHLVFGQPYCRGQGCGGVVTRVFCTALPAPPRTAAPLPDRGSSPAARDRPLPSCRTPPAPVPGGGGRAPGGGGGVGRAAGAARRVTGPWRGVRRGECAWEGGVGGVRGRCWGVAYHPGRCRVKAVSPLRLPANPSRTPNRKKNKILKKPELPKRKGGEAAARAQPPSRRGRAGPTFCFKPITWQKFIFGGAGGRGEVSPPRPRLSPSTARPPPLGGSRRPPGEAAPAAARPVPGRGRGGSDRGSAGNLGEGREKERLSGTEPPTAPRCSAPAGSAPAAAAALLPPSRPGDSGGRGRAARRGGRWVPWGGRAGAVRGGPAGRGGAGGAGPAPAVRRGGVYMGAARGTAEFPQFARCCAAAVAASARHPPSRREGDGDYFGSQANGPLLSSRGFSKPSEESGIFRSFLYFRPLQDLEMSTTLLSAFYDIDFLCKVGSTAQ